MALRIAKVFGGMADIWANLQTKYNLPLASIKAAELDLKPYQYHRSTASYTAESRAVYGENNPNED